MAQLGDVALVAAETGMAERTIYFHLSQARKKGAEVCDGQEDKRE